MNNPVPDPAPTPVPAAPSPAKPAAPFLPKAKLLPGAEKQHNRQVGHMLKSATTHRSMPMRSMQHSRGR